MTLVPEKKSMKERAAILMLDALVRDMWCSAKRTTNFSALLLLLCTPGICWVFDLDPFNRYIWRNRAAVCLLATSACYWFRVYSAGTNCV